MNEDSTTDEVILSKLLILRTQGNIEFLISATTTLSSRTNADHLIFRIYLQDSSFQQSQIENYIIHQQLAPARHNPYSNKA